MIIDINKIDKLTGYFENLGVLPANAKSRLLDVANNQFEFREQLDAADSIHLHIKVESTEALPHEKIEEIGGAPQNAKEGYIKYAFDEGYNFIFSSIPVSQEEKLGIGSFTFPHLDHIGIDIRDEEESAYTVFQKIPSVAATQAWPSKKQGGDGKKVYCCHVQVNEKYWVYPPGGVYLEFAFGKLLVSKDVFGCDLRPADPALHLSESQGCCGAEAKNDLPNMEHKGTIPAKKLSEQKNYYRAEDLKKFGEIGTFQKNLGDTFFNYYGEVFKDSALSAREKSLIALAVAHSIQCPYCIDAYTKDTYYKGFSKEQQMEAVHVAASVRAGATLVHSVQMMNKVNSLHEEAVSVQ